MKKEKYYYSEDLHRAKVQVVINHKQAIIKMGETSEYEALPRITICGIYDNEAKTMTYGVAKCSKKDTFKRKIGQKISYARAITKPYCVVQIHPEDKISNVFIENAKKIEQEILGNQ